jgi:hypothetical protein
MFAKSGIIRQEGKNEKNPDKTNKKRLPVTDSLILIV